VAVADGATESVASGPWAGILARTYGASRARVVSYDHLARVAARRWQRWQARYIAQVQRQGGLPWFVEAGLQRGAFAALVGLTVTEGQRGDAADPAGAEDVNPVGGRWQALAVGDSCLFQVRGGELLLAFPLSQSATFDSRPALLCSHPAGNARLRERVATAAGTWCSGDRFYLMTDALAAWFLRQHEADSQPWQQIDALDDASAFAGWVDALRRSGALRNDDVTLLRLAVS
jgi:glutathione S-transferase